MAPQESFGIRPPRVLIVDDHPMVAEMLAMLVRSSFADAELLFADTLGGALEQVRASQKIDLTLLDLGLPDCSGMQALMVFRHAAPSARVVVVSLTNDSATIHRALEAGASGYIPKAHPARLIGAALRLVADGGVYVPPEALKPFGAEEPQPVSHPFTPRQFDVMRLIARGLANKQIAEELKIAEDTVKQHARAAYVVLGVSSRTQAMTTLARLRIALD